MMEWVDWLLVVSFPVAGTLLALIWREVRKL